MVSSKKIFRCLKLFSLSVLFISAYGFAFAALDVIEGVFCATGQKKCCVDGKMTFVDESTKFCLTSCTAMVEDCNKGDVQYKPSGSCGTTSRTCCGLGEWSGWGEECPKTCEGTKPATSQSCGIKGTQTRTVTCNTSTGEWVEGAWGTCKEQVCTPGEVGPCPTNCYQTRTCNSTGTAWGSCYCENKDEIWNVTMTYQNVTQSTITCEAHCCCDGETPISNMYNKYLNKDVGTGCLGTNGKAEYYCGCKPKGSDTHTGYTGTWSQCER